MRHVFDSIDPVTQPKVKPPYQVFRVRVIFVVVMLQVLILLHDHIDGEGGIASPQLRAHTARLSLVRGGIVLQPLSGKRTRIRMVGTFQAHIGMVPAWLVDWVAATMCQTGVLRWEAAAQRITQRPGLGAASGAAGSEQDLYRWLAERCRMQER